MNLGEGLVQKTRMQSLEEGRKEGKALGRTEGRMEEKANNVQLLMKNMRISFDEVVILLEIKEDEKEAIEQIVELNKS